MSFTVEEGKIYGFLGPNGAGKTTTMNVMTGYIAADGGTVVIDGHDILKEPLAAKACVGYLPEVPPLYPDMTVREFLLFAAELRKVPRAERKKRVADLEERLSLSEMSHRLIKNLSKGYKQRVGLAQALVGDPKVLILDEPMVGLDPKQIIEMRDLIKGLAGKHTVILSSHILSEISAVCDHILIISKGKLAASGSPEELQKMMQGTAELAVTVIGEQEQAQAVLEQIREIEQFTFEEGGEEDSILIHISTKDDVDIRKSLSVALAGAGMPILSMNRSEKSLEDIFLELTEMEEDLEGKDGTELSEESEQGETEPPEVSRTGDETDAHGVSAQEEASAAVTEKEETDIAAGETAAGKEETDESDL
jgi:ABC-2 type transport system ATP-binding protein